MRTRRLYVWSMLLFAGCGSGYSDKLAEQLKPRRERTRDMAATIHRFLGVDDDWENIENWDTYTMPGIGGAGLDTAIIPRSVSQDLLTNVDRTGDGAHATAVLTLAANAGDAETVEVNGTTYTWDAAPLTDSANQVLIGATASDSIDNLVAAINAAAGAGTLYGTGTARHTTVTAAAGAGDTMDATARHSGTAGNAYTTSETMANGSWDGPATFSGGTDDVGLDLAHLLIEDKCPANIGASGSRLKLTATKVTRFGKGDFYWSNETGTGNENSGRVIITTDNKAGTYIDQSGAIIVRIEITAGYVTLALPDNGAADGLQELAISGRAPGDAVVTLASSCAEVDYLTMTNGIVTSSASEHNFTVVSGGQITFTTDAGFKTGSDVLFIAGGTVIFNTAETLSFCWLLRGLMDTTQNSLTKTIGAMAVDRGRLIANDDLVAWSKYEVGVP
jgi:hypothetical protein